jgi:hypothetical protein
MVMAGFQLSLTYLGARAHDLRHGTRQGLSVIVLADAICASHGAADSRRDLPACFHACLHTCLALGLHDLNSLPSAHDAVSGHGRYKPRERAVGMDVDVTC